MSGSTITVTGSSAPSENIAVTFDGTNVIVSGEWLGFSTMETVTVSLATLTQLTINGASGRDILTITGPINLGTADLIALAEVIIVNGSLTTTGDVTLTASDSSSGAVIDGVLDCLVPVLNGDPPSIGTHCAGASVTLDGADIDAASVTVSATATVTPDSFNALVPNSNASVTVQNGSSITASAGVVLEAISQLTPLLEEDTVGVPLRDLFGDRHGQRGHDQRGIDTPDLVEVDDRQRQQRAGGPQDRRRRR